MITVTVDCNSDRIELDNGDGKPINISFKSLLDSRNIEAMLEELLNMLDHSGTKLVRIDEDTRRTIGEW